MILLLCPCPGIQPFPLLRRTETRRWYERLDGADVPDVIGDIRRAENR